MGKLVLIGIVVASVLLEVAFTGETMTLYKLVNDHKIGTRDETLQNFSHYAILFCEGISLT